MKKILFWILVALTAFILPHCSDLSPLWFWSWYRNIAVGWINSNPSWALGLFMAEFVLLLPLTSALAEQKWEQKLERRDR